MAVFKQNRGSCIVIDSTRWTKLNLLLSISLQEIRIKKFSFKIKIIKMQIKTEDII